MRALRILHETSPAIRAYRQSAAIAYDPDSIFASEDIIQPGIYADLDFLEVVPIAART
jgi:hypothetical protein